MDAIPMDLKLAIGIGIGMFLAIIGFHNAGVVVVGTGHPDHDRPRPHDAQDPRVLHHARPDRGVGRPERPWGDPDRHRLRHAGRDRHQHRLGRQAGVDERDRPDPLEDRGVPRLRPRRQLQLQGVQRAQLLDRDRRDPVRHAVGLLRHDGHGHRPREGSRAAGQGREAARYPQRAAGRRSRGRGRRRRLGVVEHDLHRVRRGHRRRRPHGHDLGGGRRAVPARHVLLADRGDRATGGDRPGADHRRLLHDEERRRYRLARRRDRHPRVPHDHA